MPESRGRRKTTRKRPSQKRGSGAALSAGVRQAAPQSGGGGWLHRLRRRFRKRMGRWLLIGASALIGILVIASLALSSYQGGGTSGGGKGSLVEGVGTAVPLMSSSDHRPEGEFVSYSTTPPTSGPHWPRWADCGVYDTEVPDERVVHNLEHGQVVISYNLPDREEAARMLEVAKGLPDLARWGVVRPYSKIDEGTVAVTAWGVTDAVTGVDGERIKKFYVTYVSNRFSEETRNAGPIACTNSVSRG